MIYEYMYLFIYYFLFNLIIVIYLIVNFRYYVLKKALKFKLEMIEVEGMGDEVREIYLGI